ncbi:MAG: type I methionyl aminopeptidase [Acidimicrobiia bacterium]|nr:type I methionyl aminopeptidase [Acidimicrobiia bacterium]MDH3463291.1 type I methionyl aminopeptidase [Acidimicrobiia bacterium]
MISIKSRREFAKMQRAGATVAAIHQAVREKAAPGVSLLELEVISARIIEEHGCTSSFLNYLGSYPATLCLCPNDVIVHGIPSDYRLEEGDVLSVDAGAIFEGFHGDAAFTMGIGEVSNEAERLISVTEQALWAGIKQVQKGNRLGDIGAAVAEVGSLYGYGVVEEYVGHGIGRQMHEEPQVPNYGEPGSGLKLKQGMALCIEPMFNIGGRHTKVDPDGWTVRTADGTLSAHWEHTVAITPDGPMVFTASTEPLPVQFEEAQTRG